MSRKIKKYLKSDYKSGKVKYPSSLGYLSKFNFYAINEDSSGEKLVRTIEIKPIAFKRLIENSDGLKNKLSDEQEYSSELRLDIENISNSKKSILAEKEREIELLKIENIKLKSEVSKLKKENAMQEVNIKKLSDRVPEVPNNPYELKFKSHLNKIEENGVVLIGSPIPGGLPSLGRRK